MAGLIHPSSLERWQEWQSTRNRARQVKHAVTSAVRSRRGTNQMPGLVLHSREGEGDTRLLIGLDSASPTSRASLLTSLPYLRIGEVLADEPGRSQAPPPRFVVSFMDTRSAPGSDVNDAGGAGALRSRDYSIDDVYLWVLRTPSGLHVAARFPGFDTARRSVTLYLGALRSLLTEIGDATVTRG